MTQRETSLRPLGLITQPNKHGQYPKGAMSTARNVVMRAPGVVEPAKAGTALATSSPGDPFTWHRLWKYSDSVYLAYGDSSGATTTFSWGLGTDITLPTYWDAAMSAGGAGKHALRSRDRMLIAADGGVIVADNTSGTSRMAGLPAMQQVTVAVVEVAGAFLEPLSDCRYRVVVTRKQSDGYLMQSPPSYAVEFRNVDAGTAAYATLTFRWAADPNLYPFAAGDVIEVYRTVQQETPTDPGETYRLATSHTLTSAEVTARSASVSDRTPDTSLGQELYTNPGQQGALQANYPPASAYGLAAFKGYTFAITPYTALKFQFKVKANADVTAPDGDAVHGIGLRRPTADATNLNATLTNVTSTDGVVAGQRITGTGIPAGTLVVSKTATTIVMSAAATATNAGITVTITDVIEIGGDLHPFGTGGDLIDSIRSNTNASYGWNILLGGIAGGFIRFFDGGPSTGYVGPIGAEEWAFVRPYYVADGVTGSPTFRATNGQNYIPALPEINATAKTAEPDYRGNRLMFSKKDQPDAWPVVSELLVGNGTIHRIVATEDVLYVFASDGLFRVTGGGPLASDWEVSPIDSSLTIANPLAADVLLGAVWAYTNRGLVAIQYDSVEEISQGLIGDVLPGVATTTTSNSSTFLVCDPVNHEARLTTTSGSTSTTYIFNTTSKAFTTQSGSGIDSATARVTCELFLPTYGVIWSVPADAGLGTVYRPSDSTYRTDALVHFQPLHGDGDPFTLKQWNDFTFLFRGAHASLTLDMFVNGVESSSDVAQTVQHGEARFTAGVGLDDAMAPHIAYGFSPDTQASAGWQLIGLSSRWSFLSEQVQK